MMTPAKRPITRNGSDCIDAIKPASAGDPVSARARRGVASFETPAPIAAAT
jgi:hypothetical protein